MQIRHRRFDSDRSLSTEDPREVPVLPGFAGVFCFSAALDAGRFADREIWPSVEDRKHVGQQRPAGTAATLASFGYSQLGTWASPILEGTWTFQNPYTGVPTGDTLTIYSVAAVPEPSQMVLVAGAGAILGAWRLRRVRRGLSAGEEALVC